MARTRYPDYDGVTRQSKANGSSSAKAETVVEGGKGAAIRAHLISKYGERAVPAAQRRASQESGRDVRGQAGGWWCPRVLRLDGPEGVAAGAAGGHRAV